MCFYFFTIGWKYCLCYSFYFEKTLEWRIMWRQFVIFIGLINPPRSCNSSGIFIYLCIYYCLSFKSYHSWRWLYYIFLSTLNSCTVYWLYLWTYLWDDDLVSNKFKMYTHIYMFVFSIIHIPSFKVNFIDVSLFQWINLFYTLFSTWYFSL